MKNAFCLALMLVAASLMIAQQTSSGANSSSNPVSDTVRNLIARQSKNLTAAAAEMPAEKYGFKPTEQQMSFGTLVAHIVKSNNFLCSKLTSQAAPSQNVSDKDAKDKLVTELKNSFTYCQTALSGVQDSQLGEPVTLFGGRQANKAAALIGLTNDWADHYGMAAMYLRLNGMLPPTAQKQAQTAAKE